MECPRCFETNLRPVARVCDQCGRWLPAFDRHTNVLCWNIFIQMHDNIYSPVYGNPKLSLRALLEEERNTSRPTDYAYPNVKFLCAYKTDDIGKGYSAGNVYTSVWIPIFPPIQLGGIEEDNPAPFSVGEDRPDSNRLIKLADGDWPAGLEPWEYALFVDDGDGTHFMYDTLGKSGRFESEEEVLKALNGQKRKLYKDNLVIARVHAVDLLTQSMVLTNSMTRLVNIGENNYKLGEEIDHSQYTWLSGRLIG